MDEFFTFHNIQRHQEHRQNSHDLPSQFYYDPGPAIDFFYRYPTGSRSDGFPSITQLEDMETMLDRLRTITNALLQHAPHIFLVCHPFTEEYLQYHNRIGQDECTASRPEIVPKLDPHRENHRYLGPLFVPPYPIPPQLEKRLLIHRLTQFQRWYKKYIGDSSLGFRHSYADVASHLRRANARRFYVDDPFALFPGITPSSFDMFSISTE